MVINERDIEHIFECLRSGVVPERGLEAFAVGIDKQRTEIHRQLKLAADREGVFKFFRGGYGCGKTFMSSLAILDAQAQGFATSFVVVSDQDLHFDKFDQLYRKVVQELGTSSCPRAALGDIIDRWIARVEDALIAGGVDENSDEFDVLFQQRMEEQLASLTDGKVSEDIVRVIRTIFILKQKGKIVEASALLSWLSGSENVSVAAKKVAEIKGDMISGDRFDYLHGILEIVKAAGYKGLVIVIDEVEKILQMRHDSRGKSLNLIRQICDLANRYPGLLWIFTATPEFYDTQCGVAGLEPLSSRIEFLAPGGFANPRQPQLELKPFDANRLKEVALKLREIYPTVNKTVLTTKVTSDFIQQLVAKVTAGFKDDVSVVPRQFLRQFVNVLDLAANDLEFDPMIAEGFKATDLTEIGIREGCLSLEVEAEYV